MTGDFKNELRKAFLEGAILLIGAIAGGVLGHFLIGEHWASTWILPVLGAWLFHCAAGYLKPTRRPEGP